MIEIQIPGRLYWPYRYRDDGPPLEEEWDIVNPEIDEWVKKTCKGYFSVSERARNYTDEEMKGKPWRGPTTRVIETFAFFEREEDAALFKLFWL